MNKPPLSTERAASVAGVTSVTIRLWILKGWLKAQVVGGRYLIMEADLVGLKPRRRAPVMRGLTIADRANIAAQREQGKPWHNISKATGISVRTLRRVVAVDLPGDSV
jgi:DNA-binding transcriptional MerR regulator